MRGKVSLSHPIEISILGTAAPLLLRLRQGALEGACSQHSSDGSIGFTTWGPRETRSTAMGKESRKPQHPSRLQSWSFHRPTAASRASTGQPSKMFIWTSGRSSTSYRHDEKRDHDLLDKRKTVTALKAGEDRAILLGLAMMVCSIMMYFLLGITLLRSYMQSVWTEETQCSLLNASITETFNCSFNCGPDCWKISQYPCLQVYVNLTSSGQKLLLYHTEETMKINSECSYIPKCGKNYEESMSLVNVVMENFRKYQRFSCFYDPEGVQKNVILTKLYSSNVLFHSLFWPTCMMIGGVAIVAMVKLTQYLSLLCERIQRINR
ncbi:calcium-activated potassium channel subunit beta-2 isoform X2 [Myiozetetes cayanensis]|uniref:calcium-activated potassium channel subunit beta-2 isoform X2 n=1 Tax=Myiozetetes cayanensis TaxID=478635 RepID=UPI0021606498|nr:calcium-activated potassium channel subunit beta-2 isoform X2 [Myiozetetes cayanensis]